jgi:hypothetical protein
MRLTLTDQVNRIILLTLQFIFSRSERTAYKGITVFVSRFTINLSFSSQDFRQPEERDWLDGRFLTARFSAATHGPTVLLRFLAVFLNCSLVCVIEIRSVDMDDRPINSLTFFEEGEHSGIKQHLRLGMA